MFRELFSFFLLGTGLLVGTPAQAELQPLRFDPAHSLIEVDVRSSLGSFVARLRAFQCDLAVEAPLQQVKTAEISFLFAELMTGRAMRDRHLREWVEETKFPKVTYHLNGLEAGAQGEMVARGELCLHGVEHAVVCPVAFLVEGEVYAIDGEMALDYRDFGLPVLRRLGVLWVNPRLRVRFHLQGRLAQEIAK